MTAIHPVVEAEIEAAKVKPTLEEMLDFARGESCRIETVQRGLIDCGVRSIPDGEQIRRMVIADSLASLVEFVTKHERAFRNLAKNPERRI